MNALSLAGLFTFGLLSGLHCLQMCGPIVLAYSLPLGKARALPAHLAYNAGRILTYMFLGAMAGAAGSGMQVLGRMAGLASGARIASGAAMIAAGIALILPRSGLVAIQTGGRFARAAGRLLQGGKLRLGLTLGFLPCGLVYAALLKSVDAGGAAAGALSMLAFGLGTAAALLGMGVASSFAGVRLGAWSSRLAALAVILTGAILLWKGLAAKPVCHG